MAAEYEIRTLTDFIKVPREKRTAMLADFSEWLDMLSAINAEVLRGLATRDLAIEPRFTWVDDGESGSRGVRLTVSRPIPPSDTKNYTVNVSAMDSNDVYQAFKDNFSEPLEDQPPIRVRRNER